jgi:5-methyltetrahydrofolate--homocysteine methyltransferase
MAALIGEFAAAGLVNIVGGCCGTTPDHIRAIAAAVAGKKPRAVPAVTPLLRLSGLEAFALTPEIPFVNVGERTNVTGSARFRKLITAGDYAAALAVARDQVENGAQILDVNMDEGLLDSEKAMTTFLNLIAAEPDIARVPLMIDSSKFSVIEAGLKCVQGKAVVNSISLKEGEEAFIRHAETVRRYGAAVVVMAFDEKGQADTLERKTAITARAYDILVNRVGFPPQDIIFDPNIFAIATGMEEHNGYGVAFIEGARWIRQNLPHAHVSGGVSNLSFSFRGNELVREAMHSVFLYHAIAAGMDLGIINAGQIAVYDDLDRELREACEDVVLNRRTDASERLLALAQRHRGHGREKKEADLSWREWPVEKRLSHALVHGTHRLHRGRCRRSKAQRAAPARRDRGPAHGRHEHGRRPVRLGAHVPAASGEVGAGDEAGRRLSAAVHGAGQGRSLPHVLERQDRARYRQRRRARHRQEHRRRRPAMQQLRRGRSRRHGAGGEILQAATAEQADIIGLSGLITPSLDEMCHVAAEMERQGFEVPLLIGGATTSRVHTAVKIHPNYRRGQTVYVNDASRAVGVVSSLLGRETRHRVVTEIRAEYARIAAAHARGEATKQRLSLADARVNALKLNWSGNYVPPAPHLIGTHRLPDIPISELVGYIDWTPFFATWELNGKFPAIFDDAKVGEAARSLYADAQEMLGRIAAEGWFRAAAVIGIWPANGEGDDILLFDNEARSEPIATLHTLRQQLARREGRSNVALADFVAPRASALADYIGAFAVTAGLGEDAVVERSARQ